MDRHLKAIKQQEQLKTALQQTYELLLSKLESDEINEGKIYRLAACIGTTADGLPLQVNLELNLNEPTFQPLHSILTYSEPVYPVNAPGKTGKPRYSIHVDDLFSMNGD